MPDCRLFRDFIEFAVPLVKFAYSLFQRRAGLETEITLQP